MLTRIIDDGRSLDGLLETRHGPTALQTLEENDRRLVRAIVTTALRHRGEITAALRSVMNRAPPSKARHLIHTLHVATAQILFMDVPDSAAVDLAITALRDNTRSTRFAGFANAVLRRLTREKDTFLSNHTADESARINMPDWLWLRTRKAYGRDRAQAIAAIHQLEPVIDVTVANDPQNWAKKLGGVHLFGNTLRVGRPGPVETWPGFDDGAWWVQDAAASLPVHLFGDITGKRVADLCAAPGGKTAQLVAAGGQVTALEASEDRSVRLRNNLSRLSMTAKIIMGDLFEWEPDEPFDAILLDPPCSSTGTIRRHPDIGWAKTGDDVAKLAELQSAMIVRAAGMLKPGGHLVFSNCSLDRSEGEDVYAKICRGDHGLTADPITADEVFGHAEFITGQGTVRTLPCHLPDITPPPETNFDRARMAGLDGFFAGRFRKT